MTAARVCSWPCRSSTGQGSRSARLALRMWRPCLRVWVVCHDRRGRVAVAVAGAAAGAVAVVVAVAVAGAAAGGVAVVVAVAVAGAGAGAGAGRVRSSILV